MRLGEIKQKLDKVIDDNAQIVIAHEHMYDGQVYQVLNYFEIVDALIILASFKWSQIDLGDLKSFISEQNEEANINVIVQDRFGKFNEYVNKVNKNLPIFYSMPDELEDPQDEKTINIKLPDKISSLSELNKFNTRLERLFKCFQVDGTFVFKEFDKGTEWYEFIVNGSLTYMYFLGALKIAQEYFKTKTEYFKTKEAQINFEMLKKRAQDINNEQYQKQYLDSFIEVEVQDLINNKIDQTNGETRDSLEAKLITATKELVRELGEGTEFHLSLNPPKYAQEHCGQLQIDYRKISPEEKSPTVELATPLDQDIQPEENV